MESYDGTTEYVQGRDWRLEKNKLIVTEESRIPVTDWNTFYYPKDTAKPDIVRREAAQYGLEPVATTDGRYLNVTAIEHPERLTRWQLAVTYRTLEEWHGYSPVSMIQNLPRLSNKLKNKEAITIVLFGDSICYGCDCSGLYSQAPNQPVFGELVRKELEDFYHTKVTLYNTSVIGKDTAWAIHQIDAAVCKYKPDLVILGFGMNDRCPGREYRELTANLRGKIQKQLPEAEFVLIGTSVPNHLLATPPVHFSMFQNEYASALRPLCGYGTIIADIWHIQEYILKKKRYIDITGNNINHPNDYLARIYAQVILTVLKP